MKKLLSACLALLLLASLSVPALAEGVRLAAPYTGDTNNILLWVILLAVSALAVVAGVALFAKKNRKKKRR